MGQFTPVNSTVIVGDCEVSLRSSSQQHPLNMSNAIGSSRESNPSRRICHLRAVPLGHVADNGPAVRSDTGTLRSDTGKCELASIFSFSSCCVVYAKIVLPTTGNCCNVCILISCFLSYVFCFVLFFDLSVNLRLYSKLKCL